MQTQRWQQFAVVAVLLLLLAPVARGQTLRKYVLASGATLAADQQSNIAMAGTIGQPLIGRSTNSTTHAGAFGFWYTFPTDPTNSVGEEYTGGVTGVSATLQVYPNPVTDFAEIRIGLPTNGHVSLKVYDAVGTLRMVLIDDRREAGTITVSMTVDELASGNYTVVLKSNGAQRTTALRVIR